MSPEQVNSLLIPIGFIAFFYLFAIRPQRKRDKEVKELRENLRVGDEIITIGGIKGKITRVKEDYVSLEVGSAKTKIEVTRWAVGTVVNSKGGNKDSSKKEATTTDTKSKEDSKDNTTKD